MKPLHAAALLCALAAGCSRESGHDANGPAAKPAREAPPPSDFIRFVDAGPEDSRLDTAIVNYRDASGREVALVAAVHVGDASYYDELNRIFPHFDAVLYEVIAPKGTVPQPGRGEESAVGMLQLLMRDVLHLEFQLDQIDYTRPNFVHADLDPDTLVARMEARGESFFTMFMRLIVEGTRTMQEPGASEKAQGAQMAMMLSFFSVDREARARRLKHVLGSQFADLEKMFASMEANDPSGEGSLLVGERNKAAMAVVDERFDAGDRRLAIFYGAGHLPDFERRLQDQGFAKFSEVWLTAWDI
jgi:hypothetical protein